RDYPLGREDRCQQTNRHLVSQPDLVRCLAVRHPEIISQKRLTHDHCPGRSNAVTKSADWLHRRFPTMLMSALKRAPPETRERFERQPKPAAWSEDC
ncbi:MAG TPA: hypothetical protein VEO01_34690, partial [Pseudonocardiaceae bacterium]|nr:hypothetical protein [Pseudonocardiaceae bacterium]